MNALVGRLRRRLIYDGLLKTYGLRRLESLQKSPTRSQAHTYTAWLRSPGQLDALCGPVLERWQNRSGGGGKLAIQLFAASTGAEAYTIASTLLHRKPGLDFGIQASDLHAHTVEQARSGRYAAREVEQGGAPREFIDRTFLRLPDGALEVRPEIRARVRFDQGNLLESASLAAHHGPGDLLFLQNVLCHLSLEQGAVAFAHVLAFAKPGAALFLDGTPLDLRQRLTQAAGLQPLDFSVRAIHNHARIHIPERWWSVYYGLEPYSAKGPDPVRRYATIFLRGEASAGRAPLAEPS